MGRRSFPQIFFTPFPKILIDVKYRYDRYDTGKSKVNLHVQDRYKVSFRSQIFGYLVFIKTNQLLFNSHGGNTH